MRRLCALLARIIKSPPPSQVAGANLTPSTHTFVYPIRSVAAHFLASASRAGQWHARATLFPAPRFLCCAVRCSVQATHQHGRTEKNDSRRLHPHWSMLPLLRHCSHSHTQAAVSFYLSALGSTLTPSTRVSSVTEQSAQRSVQLTCPLDSDDPLPTRPNHAGQGTQQETA